MTNFDISTVDLITQSCLNLLMKLPKSGKPNENEWTVLACVVKYDSENGDIEVVSLGTGSKCIGATKMSPQGDILNDSHAEVIARRGFLVYLYDNIEKAIEGKHSVFIQENNKFKLIETIEFVFYSSQLPCGDASIIPKLCEEDQFGDIIKSNKRCADQDISDTIIKKKKSEIIEDIHRTGAKCLPESLQDAKEPGVKYHVLGQVRTKPGRGDRTLSVSCSDKIARWVHIGIQGALLDMILVEPIYIKHFIFGADIAYSTETLNRAVLNRVPDCSTDVAPVFIPKFYQSCLSFYFIKGKQRSSPAPASIVWIKRDNQCLEVVVQGKKLGVTKKKSNLKNTLCICKLNLYKRFHELLNKNIALKNSIYNNDNIKNIPYNEMKKKAKRYYENWSRVKNDFFKVWTVKPDIWNFCIDVK